jgi:hypothetical protein
LWAKRKLGSVLLLLIIFVYNFIFGEDGKYRKHQQLSAINKFSVRNDSVSVIGEDVLDMVGHMIEADLQDNLLWQWSEVAKLGENMPQLQHLLLHGNHLEPLTVEIASTLPSGCFSHLQVLALNNCNLTKWAQLQLLEPHLPIIQELYVANNRFSDLPIDNGDGSTDSSAVSVVQGFQNLRILDISVCGLVDWNQVQTFGHLPNLQELVLDGNAELPHVAAPLPDTFRTLYRMSLSGTGLQAWSDIDTLALYPIELLRITNIPLFVNKGASEVRPLVIARMGQLQVLNASKISPRERDDSEKTYLRVILREKDAWLASQPRDQTVFAQAAAAGSSSTSDREEDAQRALALFHPRFQVLFDRYGADITAAVKAAAGGNMAAELISITFKNLSFGSNGSLEPITKKLPRSLTVSKLHLLVKQLFGLEPRLQQLALRVYKDSVPTVLEDDMSTLAYYGAIDGAEVFVNEDKA